MESNQNCCEANKKETSGFWSGLLYGLLPHSFCIAFIIFTVLGVTALTGLFRTFLLIPYFFHFLIGLSFVLATISASIYLKRNGLLSLSGIKKKWRYLFILYGMTMGINLLFFTLVFPRVANLQSVDRRVLSEARASVVLDVQIPCSGHAPLIIEELKNLDGIGSVFFNSSGYFEVGYDADKISPQQILSLEVFKTYQAKIL